MSDAQTGTMLADRALLKLAGPDVIGFLQGLVTQDVERLSTGPAWSALLTPQGKVLFDFILWPDGDDIVIDCELSAREALARRLALYRLRRPITIEPVEGSVHWSPSPGLGTPDPRLAELGFRWLGTPSQTTSRWHAHRLALGVTEGVAELGSGDTLWLECNARELGGVSFTKGCYVGQENTARMHHRAKVNRRLITAPITDGVATHPVRVRHDDLGLIVQLRRTDALGDAHIPAWLAQALEHDREDGVN